MVDFPDFPHRQHEIKGIQEAHSRQSPCPCHFRRGWFSLEPLRGKASCKRFSRETRLKCWAKGVDIWLPYRFTKGSICRVWDTMGYITTNGFLDMIGYEKPTGNQHILPAIRCPLEYSSTTVQLAMFLTIINQLDIFSSLFHPNSNHSNPKKDTWDIIWDIMIIMWAYIYIYNVLIPGRTSGHWIPGNKWSPMISIPNPEIPGSRSHQNRWDFCRYIVDMVYLNVFDRFLQGSSEFF